MLSIPLYSDEFVGRHDELTYLHDEFRSSCDTRSRFLLVEGEAGIGKSRLIQKFLAEIAHEATAAIGLCSEDVRTPYGPFTEIMDRLDPRRTLVNPRPRVMGIQSEEKAAYFTAVGETIRRESTRKPLIMVIEDAQSADEATLELARFLVQRLEAKGALLILTVRPDSAVSNTALTRLRSTVSRGRFSTLVLNGLRRTEIRHLVNEILRRHSLHLDSAAVGQVEALSEGNPLFAEELVRIAVENRTLNLHRTMPLSLQSILAERLEPFAPSERELFVRAAIIGSDFDVTLLAMIAEINTSTVVGLMQRAVDHGLVSENKSDPLRFRFRHALIRQALADRLLFALAAPLHVRIAQALEALPDAAERAAELAYHWSEARVAEKARIWNENAAEAAWGVYAYRDAIRFYSSALEWEYPAGERRGAIYERLGMLLYIDGCSEEPTQWFERACAEYEAVGNPLGAIRVLLLLADQAWVDARTSEGLALASTAHARASEISDVELRVQTLLTMARLAATLGDPFTALGYLSRIEQDIHELVPATQAVFHEVRGEALAMSGSTAIALAELRKAAALACESGESDLVAQIENNFALAAVDLGELELAVQRHRIALAEANRTGMMWRVAYSSLNYAWTLVLKGELDAARSLVWDALETGVTTATFKTKVASVGIRLSLLLNDRSLLNACCDESVLHYARRSGEGQRIGSVTSALAELYWAQGSYAKAADLLAAKLSSVNHAHRCWTYFVSIAQIGSAADILAARGVLASAAARPRVRRAYRLLFEAIVKSRDGPNTHQRMAELAARSFEGLGNLLHGALALELAGREDDALRLYREMGSVRDIDRLKGKGKKVPPSTLTLRQTQIADLVALGKTNRSIAAELRISEHTVEHHVSEIFARLGIKSRAKLAALQSLAQATL